ncbi:MAG: hypothetical protein AB1894_15105 [Chloroflexota bacterium]
MLPFYRQALDSQLLCSRAYLHNLQSLFERDQVNGLIELHLREDHQIVLAYTRGELAGAFRLRQQQSLPLQPEQVTADWGAEEVPARTVNLPVAGVRAALQALEWYPPQQQDEIPSTQVEKYIENSQAQGDNGLLRIQSPSADGFMLLWRGAPVSSEVIFSTRSGFSDSPPAVRMIQDQPSETWKISFYPAREETPTYQVLLLRMGVVTWVEKHLGFYQQFVGQKLLLSLVQDLNMLSRQKRWGIQLVGTVLIDQRLRSNAEEGAPVYHAMLQALTRQVVQVIGTRFAQQLLSESLSALGEPEQNALNMQGLTISSIV